jgi:tetratricopeptide (TPR) repeat protein
MRNFLYIVLAGSLLLSGCKTTQSIQTVYDEDAVWEAMEAAVAAEREGNLSLAIEHYKQALTQTSEHSLFIQERMADIYVYQRDFENAESIYKQIIKQCPNNGIGYEWLGNLLFYKADYTQNPRYYREAIKYFQQGAKRNLNDKRDRARFYTNIGFTWIQLENYNRAIIALRRAIATQEGFLEQAYTNLGHAYRKKGDLNAAEKILQEAINLGAVQPLTYNNLASIYFDRRNYAQAINVLEQYLQANPENAEVYGNLSYYYIFTKEYEKSEQAARKGLSIDCTQNWIGGNLAPALLFQGRYEEAEETFLKLVGIMCFDGVSCAKACLDDFDEFEKAGVIPESQKENVEKIRRLLNR